MIRVVLSPSFKAAYLSRPDCPSLNNPASQTTLGSVFALPSRRVIEQCEWENGNR